MSFFHIATAAHLDRNVARIADPVVFLRPLDRDVVQALLDEFPSIREDTHFLLNEWYLRVTYFDLGGDIDVSRSFLRELRKRTGCSLFEMHHGGQRFKGFIDHF